MKQISHAVLYQEYLECTNLLLFAIINSFTDDIFYSFFYRVIKPLEQVISVAVI